jgi:HK97 family phage major capsid protein
MTQAPPRIETKSAGDDFTNLNEAFAAFREANDERLAQIEHRMGADVVTQEKLARIDRTLDETKRRLDAQALENARPRLGAEAREEGPAARHAQREHKAAFRAYMRSGESGGLKTFEEKAMSVTSGPDGGFLVPTPAEREIVQRLANISPIRAISTVREISGASYRKAYPVLAAAAGWVAENVARAQTNSPQIADMNFPAMELYAMPSATQTLLDDSALDLEQWLAEEIDTVFAEQEGAAFVNGNGAGRPMGFLAYTKTTMNALGHGKIGYLPTGAAGALPAANPSDILIDLIYSLRAGYRQNARFVMNRKTQAAIRKLKTSTGEYLWQPPAVAGAGASLMNFPIVEAEDMPDIAADSFSLAYGDFRRGYIVVDRLGVRVLRDPYSAKPYVLFYVTKRVGGGVQDFDAIRLLKFGVA